MEKTPHESNGGSIYTGKIEDLDKRHLPSCGNTEKLTRYLTKKLKRELNKEGCPENN